jgi:hypothetical protein
MSKNYEMTEEQEISYRSIISHVLKEYPDEPINRKFEMTIDMCDLVDWEHEMECDSIFTEYWFKEEKSQIDTRRKSIRRKNEGEFTGKIPSRMFV